MNRAVLQQPPPFIRTKRPFSCKVQSPSARIRVKAELFYDESGAGEPERVPSSAGELLAGSVAEADESGACVFPNLSVQQASACEAHGHQKFRLGFRCAAAQAPFAFSDPFTAYSHTKVLQRLRDVKTYKIAPSSWPASGGVECILVGEPVVRSPTLAIRVTLRQHLQPPSPPPAAAALDLDLGPSLPASPSQSLLDFSTSLVLDDSSDGDRSFADFLMGSTAPLACSIALPTAAASTPAVAAGWTDSVGRTLAHAAVAGARAEATGTAAAAGAGATAASEAMAWRKPSPALNSSPLVVTVPLAQLTPLTKTALCFRAPPCPVRLCKGSTLTAELQFTVDGVHFSEPVEITYVGDACFAHPHKRQRSML
mmetsp:Transcript_13801/g.44175  ORF Transcript_13801/g.44175 Transcript_13801/m.44175 type:complete len:369 (+) Transcript_13801:2-1108(+)